MSTRSELGNPHGWNTLDNYLQVHARHLEDYRDEGFIVEDGLVFRWLRADRLVIAGRVHCQGGLFIDVKKILAVRRTGGKRQVRTIRYAYHAGVEGPKKRSIFRHDNAHSYVRENHPDTHHKHRLTLQHGKSWHLRSGSAKIVGRT